MPNASRWQKFLSMTASASLRQLLLLGAVLLLLIWSSVIWQAERIKREQLANFGLDLMHLSEVLDETVVRQLQEIDNALLILRSEYVNNKPNLKHTLSLLRQGPLKNLDVNVIFVDRHGYVEMTELPGSFSNVYAGDREHFKHFIKGSPDSLFISDPVLGRLTKRWGMQLVRPILDHEGKFLGTVVIFMPPEQLTQFMQSLQVGSDTVMTVFSTQGVMLSRSKDIDKLLGSRQTPQQLAEFPRNQNGFITRLSALDQVERVIAYRWIRSYPLLLLVARPKTSLIAEIAREQRLLMALGAVVSLIVGGALLLLGVSFRRRERAEALLQREHVHLVEAQRISRLGSWELDLQTNRLSWSDEVFRIFEIDKSQRPASYEAFLKVIHPDDRGRVHQTYIDSLKTRMPYDIVHRLRLDDGRIKWVREQCATDFDDTGQATRSSGTVQDITEHKREEAEREALSRERLLLLESTEEGIYGLDLQGHCTFINQAAARLLGFEVAEILGQDVHALVHHRHADGSPYPSALCPINQSSISGQSCKKDHEVFWRKDGTPVPVTYTAYPIRDDNRITGTLVTFSDITERRQAEVELRIAEVAFQTQEGMFVTDANGVILRINRAFTEITGFTAADLVGRNPSIRSSGRHDAAFFAEMWTSIKIRGAWKGEIWNLHKNGETHPEAVTITAVMGDDARVTHYVATVHDITERKASEEQIKNLAFLDPLTRLSNRRLLQDRLQQALVASVRSKNPVALMFVDLDKFKVLNDTWGHDVGDLLLQQVARRLQDCVRETDTVARLGGDEFVVLLDELGEQGDQARRQAEQVGKKILAALNQPYELAGNQHLCTPSIGVTLSTGQSHTGDELLKQADLAMYRAKAAGRNTLHFFDPSMLAASEVPPLDLARPA